MLVPTLFEDEIHLHSRTYRVYPRQIGSKVILLAAEVHGIIQVEFPRSVDRRDDQPMARLTIAAAESHETAQVT